MPNETITKLEKCGFPIKDSPYGGGEFLEMRGSIPIYKKEYLTPTTDELLDSVSLMIDKIDFGDYELQEDTTLKRNKDVKVTGESIKEQDGYWRNPIGRGKTLQEAIANMIIKAVEYGYRWDDKGRLTT